jgi:16S rRNA processing protein RimM
VAAEPFSRLTLARLLRPWGRRGEVAAEILTDFPERLITLKEAMLWDGNTRTPPRVAQIRSCRIHLGQALFHFAGIDSINDAETLRGLEVQVPFEERTDLPQDRHYVDELVGCEVWEQGADSLLGTVRAVENTGAATESWLLTVDTPRGELLIPLAAEICVRIDTAAHRIEVRLPQGLRDLNR